MSEYDVAVDDTLITELRCGLGATAPESALPGDDARIEPRTVTTNPSPHGGRPNRPIETEDT